MLPPCSRSGSKIVLQAADRPRFGTLENHLFSLVQFVEQRPRFLKIGGVEALGEPGMDGREQVVGLGPPALLPPKPGEVGRGPQLPQLRGPLSGNGHGAEEASFGRGSIATGQTQLSLEPMRFRLEPALAACAPRIQGFGEQALALRHSARGAPTRAQKGEEYGTKSPPPVAR
jgi:hypothetical protein